MKQLKVSFPDILNTLGLFLVLLASFYWSPELKIGSGFWEGAAGIWKNSKESAIFLAGEPQELFPVYSESFVLLQELFGFGYMRSITKHKIQKDHRKLAISCLAWFLALAGIKSCSIIPSKRKPLSLRGGPEKRHNEPMAEAVAIRTCSSRFAAVTV